MAEPPPAPSSSGGLHHLGVRVADLDRATAFYRALGAVPLAEPLTLGGRAAGLAMNAPRGTSVRIALLGFPDGSGVELFEFDPDPEWCGPIDAAARLPHLGIRVDDVDAALAAAEAAGGRRLWPEPSHWGSVRVVYLCDPDGTVLELLDGPLVDVAKVIVARR
ncbi:VOC family protein [Pseudonocardia sp. RS11V-5]|uniref:VOC family protein n=1 Tax=Pseudonocardia terrae TaxID=2905831 RepID=UPI001E4D7850|nr:VOC family protein [Pseudonocardia terrae]MCE3551657.1 VOC family protein [Pseudonocardia terrae]